jgi:Anti-sigma-K factor rskA/Putative zinc-finger
MSSQDHHLSEDIGAYLLGALDQSEVERFESHLPNCPDCREQLERLRPAADALPRSVEQMAAPPALKRALVKTVRKDARRQGTRAWGERLRNFLPGRMTPTVAWGSAAFVLLAGVALGVGGATLLDDGGERTISASATPGQVPDAAGGRLSIEGTGEHGGILRVHGLAPLARGRVYQAWVQRAGSVAPQPTFEVTPDGRGAVAVPDDLRDADAVLVTREPHGGARTPSEPPIMQVRL